MNNYDLIKDYMSSRISRILFASSESEARASLANLRRGIGRTPGELPELWGDFLLGMPEELYGKGNVVSHAEWAVYISLTLFALHQQGKDRKNMPMHKNGISLGKATNCLIKDEDSDRTRIARRFYSAATAKDMTELAYHLRGLVTLLRTDGIPLDYVMLACDLYSFRDPDKREKVLLRWGEDFCRLRMNNDEDKTNE